MVTMVGGARGGGGAGGGGPATDDAMSADDTEAPSPSDGNGGVLPEAKVRAWV